MAHTVEISLMKAYARAAVDAAENGTIRDRTETLRNFFTYASPARILHLLENQVWWPFKVTHTHYKGGGYQLIKRGALYVTGSQDNVRTMNIYRNEAGEWYVRDETDFDSWVPDAGKHRFKEVT